MDYFLSFFSVVWALCCYCLCRHVTPESKPVSACRGGCCGRILRNQDDRPWSSTVPGGWATGHCVATYYTTLFPDTMTVNTVFCGSDLSPSAPVLWGSGEVAELLQRPYCSAGEGRHGRRGAETWDGAAAGMLTLRLSLCRLTWDSNRGPSVMAQGAPIVM